MISVIIPARNAAGTIGATMASLVGDRALILEILLIDDGSDDDTVSNAEQVAKHHALPLRAIRVQVASAGAARNVGLAQARGSHVFYLDADDEVLPGALTLLYDALVTNPTAGLAIGPSIHRASRGDKLKVPGGYSDDRQENARNIWQTNCARSPSAVRWSMRKRRQGCGFPSRSASTKIPCTGPPC